MDLDVFYDVTHDTFCISLQKHSSIEFVQLFYIKQGFRGIRLWTIKLYTSPIMINKITTIDKKEWTLKTSLELNNHNSIKEPTWF